MKLLGPYDGAVQHESEALDRSASFLEPFCRPFCHREGLPCRSFLDPWRRRGCCADSHEKNRHSPGKQASSTRSLYKMVAPNSRRQLNAFAAQQNHQNSCTEISPLAPVSSASWGRCATDAERQDRLGFPCRTHATKIQAHGHTPKRNSYLDRRNLAEWNT